MHSKKKGCKLLPKISGLKEYSIGGKTSNLNGGFGKTRKKRKRQKAKERKTRTDNWTG